MPRSSLAEVIPLSSAAERIENVVLAPTVKKRIKVGPNLYQRTRDGKFEDIRVNPATGRQQQQTLRAKTLTEAKREQRALAVQIDRGETVAPTRTTVAEVAADYFEAAEARVASGEQAGRTLDLYRQRWSSHLEPRIGRVKVQSLQPTHVSTLLRELREAGLSSWTSHGILTALGAILNHAVARGWITESPTKRLARGERPRARNARRIYVPTPEQTESIVTAATKRWKPLLVTLAHTAARVSEVLALTVADIDWSAGSISISKQLDRSGRVVHRTKSESGVRTIKMSPELRRVLRAHLDETSRSEGFVFGTASGHAPSYRNARREFDRAVKAAGIEYDTETHRLSLHSLRHAGVSALIRNGADPVRVARFVGDKVETVLSTYAQEWAAAKDDDLADVLGAALAVGG